MEITYYTHNREWKKVLEKASKLDPSDFNIFVNHCTNLALFKTGRLASDMFSYPQRTSAGLLLTTPRYQKARCDLYQSYIFMEMGYVNIAEKA